MIFASPVLVRLAFSFGPADLFSIMLLGLVAGSTMAGGSPLKGIIMTSLGLLVGVVGTDVNSGHARFTFGIPELSDKVELVALAMGLFAVGDFLRNVNRVGEVAPRMNVKLSEMWPSRGDFKQAFWPTMRGTLVGAAFGALPGTGPTITTFISYAIERKIAKSPERFGAGALEGVAAPEASSHSKTQVDFIPTMTLGIPGDAAMALILGVLQIQGIQPGPQIISDHADLFWGLIASFWVGNVLLIGLNVPLIGLWVRILRVPYRYMFPAALLFIAIGVFSTNNDIFDVYEVLFFGIVGAVFMMLEFPIAPVLLGYVLGPLVEENGRRALEFSQGDLSTFVRQPVSCVFLVAATILVGVQVAGWWRRTTLRT
jgi:TctA family transporter